MILLVETMYCSIVYTMSVLLGMEYWTAIEQISGVIFLATLVPSFLHPACFAGVVTGSGNVGLLVGRHLLLKQLSV